MSTTVMAACWPLQMPPTAKAVLISLADNANDHGVCWPSLATICTRTCFGRTAVIEAIQWLEEQGFLAADRATGRSSKYQIVVPSADLFGDKRPVREANRSASRTGSAGVPDPSASRTGPVRQADPNRKEPSRTVKEKDKALDFSSWPSVPSEQVLADWLDLRKRKRAPVTPTALRGMGAQLHRAAALGYDVNAALTECVLRNWQGLNADWLQPNPRNTPNAQRPAAAQSKTLSAIQKMEDMKHGLAGHRATDRVPEVALLGFGPDSGD